FELNHQDTVDLLQEQIEKEMKIKQKDQILIYNGKCLNKKKTLKEENLDRESFVTVLDINDIPEVENE
ncbi:ubiquitin-like protein, putative, partial [Hepatocystis sp. ex Piliocolobus tephrosceles]